MQQSLFTHSWSCQLQYARLAFCCLRTLYSWRNLCLSVSQHILTSSTVNASNILSTHVEQLWLNSGSALLAERLGEAFMVFATPREHPGLCPCHISPSVALRCLRRAGGEAQERVMGWKDPGQKCKRGHYHTVSQMQQHLSRPTKGKGFTQESRYAKRKAILSKTKHIVSNRGQCFQK